MLKLNKIKKSGLNLGWWEHTGRRRVFFTVEHWNLESEVKVAQSWQTLCDPMDYTVHGILQARDSQSFSRGSSQPRD